MGCHPTRRFVVHQVGMLGGHTGFDAKRAKSCCDCARPSHKSVNKAAWIVTAGKSLWTRWEQGLNAPAFQIPPESTTVAAENPVTTHHFDVKTNANGVPSRHATPRHARQGKARQVFIQRSASKRSRHKLSAGASAMSGTICSDLTHRHCRKYLGNGHWVKRCGQQAQAHDRHRHA